MIPRVREGIPTWIDRAWNRALHGGERYLDAGSTAAIPVQAATDDATTHILVLRSRLEGDEARKT
jgi:predicted patatin/cPLA2 family phospholipase